MSGLQGFSASIAPENYSLAAQLTTKIGASRMVLVMAIFFGENLLTGRSLSSTALEEC